MFSHVDKFRFSSKRTCQFENHFLATRTSQPFLVQARIAALGATMRACISAVFQQLKHKNSIAQVKKSVSTPVLGDA